MAVQVLKDGTTLEDNKITHENFVVVMVTRVRVGLICMPVTPLVFPCTHGNWR